jgi:hypothetical protein
MRHEYEIRRTKSSPGLKGMWSEPPWSRAPALGVDQFRPESSSHRPGVLARMLYDDLRLYGIFRVEDRYVRSVHTDYLAPVCRDSCVEFFVQPKAGSGYFNFEFNCGGTLYCSYITDPVRVPGGFRQFIRLPERQGREVAIFHSLPSVVEPEVSESVEWILEFSLPLSLLESYVGPLGPLDGQRWRANFYKCADDCSHPHWAAWSPVSDLNFHMPQCFGTICFVGEQA